MDLSQNLQVIEYTCTHVKNSVLICTHGIKVLVSTHIIATSVKTSVFY